MDLWPDTLAGPPTVVWDGVTWRLSDDGYYRYSRRGLLHRAVYRSVHGPIPRGGQVHHRDHNKLHNHPDNLLLLTAAEHWAEHHDERGPDWHSRGGKAAWQDREPSTYTCAVCGEQFTSRGLTAPEVCSGRCRERRYSDTRTGRTYEERVCVVCGASFSARYNAAFGKFPETCNRSCTARLAYRNRGSGI